MGKYVLKNNFNEYVKDIDTANGHLILTKNLNEAFDYGTLPGGGEWASDNTNRFIQYHFKDELGDRVTTLKPKYERGEECTNDEWYEDNEDEEQTEEDEEDGVCPQQVF